MEPFRNITDQNTVNPASIPDQRSIFGDGGLSDRTGEILDVHEIDVDEATDRVINRICEMGYDIPISYLAALHDLWYITMDLPYGGNVFIDPMVQFASDQFERLYGIVRMEGESTDPFFEVTIRLMKVGKYADLISR